MWELRVQYAPEYNARTMHLTTRVQSGTKRANLARDLTRCRKGVYSQTGSNKGQQRRASLAAASGSRGTRARQINCRRRPCFRCQVVKRPDGARSTKIRSAVTTALASAAVLFNFTSVASRRLVKGYICVY